MSDHELPLPGRVLGATCRELAAVKAERDALRQALRSLRNEVVGMLGIAKEEIRAAIGTTNLACVQRRVLEADAALAAQEADRG